MTNEPASAKPTRQASFRKLTGSQYRAIAERVKQWNPKLWDDWAELHREVEAWSAEEGLEREQEYKSRIHPLNLQVVSFLLSEGIAQSGPEAISWKDYIYTCCLQDHGLEVWNKDLLLPPG